MDYLQILKDNGLKATPQRIAVLKVLDKHIHPNIDELYEQIKSEYPSVSLATVYKNVNTLQESGLVKEVNVPNGKMRYDIFVEPHIHIVCDKCQKIQDLAHDKALSEYQSSLESLLGDFVSSLDVVAHISECSACKKI